ncbi:Membrane protein involved in the export of O-antigen and teichoic acid [Pseudoxanthomonas sp. GM95]|uniref:oligosaccharide flippase family protein n=1 Tax=Pseudoxanthomonas sp. GM95 TaxID=1881043 RepID=UPI0008BDF41D|nr:oligosaccharide flippase family protein [Pseudoxanthomonas sp. GM95]SEL09431.1 Membrane protein involved in the export of O-antigen and teichoic acid [Pseudoxanthomonas sp. GM95]
MNRSPSALRNTFFSSAGIYTEYVLGMLTSILIARHLGPHDFGVYSMVIWLVSVGMTMTNAGSSTTLIKFVAELRGGGREELIQPLLTYLRRTQRTCLLLVLVAAGVLSAFAGARLVPDFNRGVLFGLLALTISLRAPYMFNISLGKGLENFRATAAVAMVATPLNLAMVAIAWWLDASMNAFLMVFAISSMVFYGVSHYQTARLVPASSVTQLPPELKQRIVRHMRYAAITVTVGFVAASDIGVLLLNLFASSAEAGQFKVAFQLSAGAALLLPGVVGALMLPMMANALSQGLSMAGRRFVGATSYLMLLAAPLVGFGAVFASAVICLLYGPSYAAAAPVFATCLFGAAMGTVAQAGSSLLLSADRQRSMMLLTLTNALVKLLLDIVLTLHYGLAGAVAAYTITSVLTAGAVLGLAMATSGLGLDWSRLVRIVAAAGVAALAAFPVRELWSPLPVLAFGGLLFAGTYGLMTFALGCWSADDIEHMQQMHRRVPKVPGLTALLSWADKRACRGS